MSSPASNIFAGAVAGAALAGLAAVALSGHPAPELEPLARIEVTVEAPPRPARTYDPGPSRIAALPRELDEGAIREELLETTHAAVRQQLVERLGIVGSGESVPTLAEIAERDRPNVRLAAIEALGRIATPEAAAVLSGLVETGAPAERTTAVAALGRTGAHGLPVLRELAESDRLGLGSQAMLAMARAGGGDVEVELATWLESTIPSTAAAAARALGTLGTDSARDRLLAAATGHGSNALRAAAVTGLSSFDDPRSRSALDRLAYDPAMVVSQAAITGLGEIGDPRATKTLRELALGGAAQQRSNATYALTRAATPDARDALIAVLAADDDMTRHAAANGLAQIGDEESVRALLTALSGSESVTQAALNALGMLPPSDLVVRELTRLVRFGRRSSLAAAANALARQLGAGAVPLIEEALARSGRNERYMLIHALTQVEHPDAVAALRRLAESGPVDQQVQALNALARQGAMPRAELRALLAERVRTAPGHLATQLAYTLAQMGDPESMQLVLGMIEKAPTSQMHGLVNALVTNGDTQTAQSLVEMARSLVDPQRRQTMVNALASNRHPVVRQFMIEVAGSDGPEANGALMQLAWSSPEAARDVAMRAVGADTPERRQAALTVLGRLGDEESLGKIQSALKDESPLVRQSALQALVSNDTPAGAKALVAAYRDADDGMRATAAHGLAMTGLPEATELLKDTLASDNDQARWSAYYALRNLGSQDVQRWLEEQAKGTDELGKWLASQVNPTVGSVGPNVMFDF